MARVKKTEETQEQENKLSQVVKNNKKSFIFAVGRRREATARVRLYQEVSQELTWGDKALSKGQILVNQLPVEQYFPSIVEKSIYTEPLRTTNNLDKYIFTIKVAGGGKSGQLDAMVLGITRALVKVDADKNKPILKKRGFLTRDARVRERRKVGRGGKARHVKQSPKR